MKANATRNVRKPQRGAAAIHVEYDEGGNEEGEADRHQDAAPMIARELRS